MAKQKKVILGGYDAKSCPEKTRKAHDPKYRDVERDPTPPGDQARMDAGVLFEEAIGQRWTAELAPGVLAAVPALGRSDAEKKAREQATATLMGSGPHLVVWNARLVPQPKANRGGEPDALVRDGDTATWWPVDVKDHKVLEGTGKARAWLVSDLADPRREAASPRLLGPGTLKKSDALQLAHYYRMLQAAGKAAGPHGGIIGREGVLVWFPLDEALYRHPELGKVSALQWYDHEFAIRASIATQALQGLAPAMPELKDECRSCQWRTACHDELTIDLDHVTLLPGVTPARAKAHYKVGVTRRAQLARLSWHTAKLVDAGADPAALAARAKAFDPATPVEEAFSAAEAQTLREAGMATAGAVRIHAPTAKYAGSGVWSLARTIDQARVSKAGKVHRARGVDSVLTTRYRVEQDIDIEDENGYVYLIGVLTTRRQRVLTLSESKSEYRAFVNWGRDADGEARVFAEWWQHVTATQEEASASRQSYCAYHYTQHEPAAFRELAARHAGKPGVPSREDLDAYLGSKSFVDLYPILSSQLIWPTETVSLKDLAKWVRFSWRDSEPGGSNSLAWFAQAVDEASEQDAHDAQARILAYNEDDCAAQTAIRDWLTRLGEARAPGAKLPEVSALDKRFRRQLVP